MKILLINPPNFNQISGNNPEIIESERGDSPPLGLLYIAAYLGKNSKHSVNILDTQVEKLSYPQIQERIKIISPDIIGITVMTFTIMDVLEIVRIVKNINRNIKIILGGPHVYLYPEETLNLRGVDYIVLGEGEKTFTELIKNIEDQEKIKKIMGIAFKDKSGKVINTGPRPLIDDLDSLPFPARHLVPHKKYRSILAKEGPVTTIFTSRGCPYSCSFCLKPHFGRKYRMRSAKNVVDEIEECLGMGIHNFLFYDDTFTVDRQRVLDICDEIIKRKIDIIWNIRTRIDTIDREMIKKLKSAGCSAIHFGVESGSERILKILKKQISLKQASDVFNWTRKEGITVLAYFMIGSPTENKDDIYKTFDFIKKEKIDLLHLAIFTPFPGTELYLEGLREGLIEEDYWRKFAQNPTRNFTTPYWKENFSREELQHLLSDGYKEFYLRPSYISKRLLNMRSLEEIRRNICAGIKVLTM